MSFGAPSSLEHAVAAVSPFVEHSQRILESGKDVCRVVAPHRQIIKIKTYRHCVALVPTIVSGLVGDSGAKIVDQSA